MGDDRAAAVAETHSATVVFLGDRAYKIKKAVDLGFLDFSTLDARREVCHREVELNRRMAPDVYLGVADVTGPDGAVCEHMVVMRRLPDAARLSTLVRDGVDVRDHVRRIARTVAAFHSAAERSPAIAAAGSPEAVLANWEQSFEQMEPFAGGLLDRERHRDVQALVRRYLAGRAPLLQARMAAGAVCDGHGDLLADDIFCLPDGPRILDCLEFSDRLRHGDVLADVGFLAMDLERLGHPELAGLFLTTYREHAAAVFPPSLAEHYIAYRAHVRAKVACLRAAQGDPEAGRTAEPLLELALSHLRRGRVVLLLVGGLPGTGKSTVAAGVGDRLDMPVLRSDEIRKELAGVPALVPAGADYGEGIYGRSQTEATYGVLLDRARAALEMGQSTILDASFTDHRWRDAAWAVADETSSELLAVECHAPQEVAAARLRRRPQGSDPSDATPEIASRMAAAADPWPEATRLVTAGEAATAVQRVVAAVTAAA